MPNWKPPQSPPSEWSNADLEALLDHHGGVDILFYPTGYPRSERWELPVPLPLLRVCEYLYGDASEKLDQPRAVFYADSFTICDKRYWIITAYGKLIGEPIYRETL